MDSIITVEDLGKKYCLRHQAKRESYTTLRDVIVAKAKGLFQRPQKAVANGGSDTSEDFWALRGVSFEVKQGDVVGIVGRNGAGKSTLLKILSRITEPTTGQVRLRGRVASLLEVGTGFHPELTGRENVFLNGAILGMSKAEIKRKFDEIVAFAEVEKFLDTPVKRYSSGMYVRLAFAVAAHLEPEILIVDEVLAVGDAEFQRKCLGKMKDVSAQDGRTVLFVSHNMKAVQTLCRTGVVLNAGTVAFVGDAGEALKTYMKSARKGNSIQFEGDNSRPRITSVAIDEAELQSGNLVVDIGFKSPFALNPPVPGLVVTSTLGTPVFGSNPRFHADGFGHPKMAEGQIRFVVNNLPIHSGTYQLSVWLGDWQADYDEKRDILTFEFKHGDVGSNTPNPEMMGFIDTRAKWSVV